MPHATRGPRPLGPIHSGSQHHGKVQKNAMPSQITDQQRLGVGEETFRYSATNILAFPHAPLPLAPSFFPLLIFLAGTYHNVGTGPRQAL